MAKAQFVRNQPHINVGTIGHEGHGKTALTAAILSVQGKQMIGDPFAGRTQATASEARIAGRTDRTGRDNRNVNVEYATAGRHYSHIDLPGHYACGRSVYAGVAQLDAVILVVSSAKGIEAQTREHALLARRAGVQSLLVFLSKCDLPNDDATLSMLEADIRGMLEACGFGPAYDIPVVRGSARLVLQGQDAGEEAILDLIRQMESHFALPERKIDKPLLMPVAEVLSISGQGTVVTGRIQEGTVKVGEEVEILGFNATRSAVVTGLESFRRCLDRGEAGDNVGVLLRGVTPRDVRRGQVLATPGTRIPHTKFGAEVHILHADEGGRRRPFFNGYRPQLHLHTADLPCTLDITSHGDMVLPGDDLTVGVELPKPVALTKGQSFALRDSGRTIGVGTIVDVVT